MDKDDLEIDLDDDTPPWERRKEAAEPEVGTSPLAKELEESGVSTALRPAVRIGEVREALESRSFPTFPASPDVHGNRGHCR
jgi:hypothetical protein